MGQCLHLSRRFNRKKRHPSLLERCPHGTLQSAAFVAGCPAGGRDEVPCRAEQQPIQYPQRTISPRSDHQDCDGGSQKECSAPFETDGAYSLADSPDGGKEE
jgi:hypothetical protein